MKPHIGSGDKGKTSLVGKKTGKCYCNVSVLGELDELNSFIGLCRSVAIEKNQNDLDNFLEKTQKQLFVIGSELATHTGVKTKVQTKKEDVNDLEKKIIEGEKELPELKRFILPTGNKLATLLHVARSVCRRAEREVVALMQKEKINEEVLAYLNRLSDLLFVMARLANKRENIADKEWLT